MIGEIKIWYSNTLPDSSWLWCRGETFDQTEYPDLYTFLGSNTLPNIKGKVPVGLDSNDTDFDTIGETIGEKTHTLIVDEIPGHTHSVLCKTAEGSQQGWGITSVTNNTNNNIATKSTGGGEAHNNIQPSIVVNYIIKAKILVPDTKKISELDSASSITSTDVLPIVQSGETKKVTSSVLLSGKLDKTSVKTTQTTSTSDTYCCNYIDNAVKDVYSTDEIVIGTFLDKPLYRKVYHYDSLAKQSQIRLDISSLHIETVVNNIGKGHGTTTNNVEDVDFFPYGSTYGNLNIYSSNDAVTDFNGILEYTKTTD